MIEIASPLLDLIEPFIEVINLVLAMGIVVYGVRIYTLLEGQLKKAWKFFLVAIALFGLHELVGSLAEFGIIEIDGLYALTEFFFIAAFAISIVAFVKLFTSISTKKKK